MAITPAFKKWIARLLDEGCRFTTYEVKPVGSNVWKPNGVYFLVLPNGAYGRSPVRHMVKRMIDDGLLTWAEESRETSNRQEVRRLRSVLTDKAIVIHRGTEKRNERMYITDLRHCLNDKGAIGPKRGPAFVLAKFETGVVSHATDDGEQGVLAPACIKCKKHEVTAAIADDDYIYWSCNSCKTSGRIGNWQGTLWDLHEPSESPCM